MLPKQGHDRFPWVLAQAQDYPLVTFHLILNIIIRFVVKLEEKDEDVSIMHIHLT